MRKVSILYYCIERKISYTHMALINPALLTSTGTSFQVTVLPKGSNLPKKITFAASAITESAAATPTDSVTVTTTLPTGVTTASLKAGTYFRANEQNLILTNDTTVTSSTVSLIVDAVAVDVAAQTISTYVGSFPVIGLEAASRQLQKQTNQVVLLTSQGWQNTGYSTGSFSFSGTLYIPTNKSDAASANAIINALINEQYLWVERIMPNGDYSAGRVAVTDASDTAQGAGYVSVNTTFTGDGQMFVTPV